MRTVPLISPGRLESLVRGFAGVDFGAELKMDCGQCLVPFETIEDVVRAKQIHFSTSLLRRPPELSD